MRYSVAPVMVIVGFAVFAFAAQGRSGQPRVLPDPGVAVVMPAALQVLLYGGDRFLAADIEAIRAVISGGTMRGDEASFRARAHLVVSLLNPCQEDNYWIGNAELTWGGGQAESFTLLKRAMNCRIWDPWPAFFYGFSQHFFNRDVIAARTALETAAQRADEKTAAAFRDFSVKILAGQFEDAAVALDLVRREREQVKDARLRAMLDQRAKRLEGLLVLRQARKDYERQFGRPLQSPDDLVDKGILSALPVDPSKVGYALVEGEFQLRQVRHEGLESLR